MLEVTLLAESTPLTCLQAAEIAGSTISFGTANVAAVNQLIASNASGNAISSSGSIYACVAAVGAVTGSTYFQGSTSGVIPRTMPDPATVFDDYVANGTQIDINAIPLQSGVRVIKQRLISPAQNPFGATNAQGIYVIDCGGQPIELSQNRIVGTLVLLDPMGGTATSYRDETITFPPSRTTRLCWCGGISIAG